MNENVLKLLDLMSKDEELQKKFAAIHDVDEAYALAVSVLGGYTTSKVLSGKGRFSASPSRKRME